MLVTILVDGKSIDVLHHEIGQSVAGCSTIKQARDVRMFERSENLSLLAKLAQDRIGVGAALDQFDGNLLLILIVGALRQKNCAHSAASNFADDPVPIDDLAGQESVFC